MDTANTQSVPTPPTSPPSVPPPTIAFDDKKPPLSMFPKLLMIIIALLAVSGASVYFFIQAKSPNVAQVKKEEASPAPTVKPLFLMLEKPKAGDTSVDGEILVKGQTLPLATVAIFTDQDETVVESDAEGNFEETITLVKGENVLTITAFGADGQEESVRVAVTN